MRMLIIGCGYVGSSIAKFWRSKGHFVTVTTRSQERFDSLKQIADAVSLVKTESFENSLKELLKQNDVVVLSVAPSIHEDYEQTYLHTAQSLMDKIKSSVVKQIIYTSSTSVYGEQGGNWVDENTPLCPSNPNTEILCETEKILMNPLGELKTCIFRLGEIYGPGREIENRLKRLQGQLLPGTGGNYTNLIHLTDIVHALDFALTHELKGIYNLCQDLHIPRKELYEHLCLHHQLPSFQWNPNIKSIHGGNKRVSNVKIKNEGFHFTVNEGYSSKRVS